MQFWAKRFHEFLRRGGVTMALGLAAAAGSSAQEDAPAAAPRKNELGMTFAPVPGIAVLVCTTETRLADFQRFVSDAGYDWNYRPHFDQTGDHPVVGVTLKDAVAFCNWLTELERKDGRLNAEQLYRLPSNLEWGAAAGMMSQRHVSELSAENTIADQRNFFWGTAWPPPLNYANYSDTDIPGYDDGFPFTAPVGHYKPSAEGIYDLAGNVWEWTLEPAARQTAIGTLRGASWAYFRQECLKPAYIYQVPADLVAPTIGFRCVYEDRALSAKLLAAAASREAQARAEQRSELMKGKDVDAASLEEVRKRAGFSTSSSSGLPDLATLKPAAAGKDFVSSLGLPFVPLTPGSAVLIGKTEVRVQDFELWLKATSGTWKNRPTLPQGDEHPAAGVTWAEASAFCQWLTKRDQATKLLPAGAAYRLPTDAEWSAAAGLADEKGADPRQRSLADQTHFPWEQSSPGVPASMAANLDSSKMDGFEDNFSYTCPVTTTAPNALGLHDMGGNVAEWVADDWPGEPGEKTLRGPSCRSSARESLLTSARQHRAPGSTADDIGFRCVLDLPAAAP